MKVVDQGSHYNYACSIERLIVPGRIEATGMQWEFSSLSIYIFIHSNILSKEHLYNAWWVGPRQGEIARGE
jgi:hypothetical protein